MSNGDPMEESRTYLPDDFLRMGQVEFSSRQLVYLKMKRILSVILALFFLILLSPLFLVIILAVKIDSPKEKVIFKQERVGLNGRIFMIYKFRTMHNGTPEKSTSEFSNASDHVTKVGSILRVTSLDELPQLWNVLRGQMSVVGPRPLIKSETEVHNLRNYYRIYRLRPGITGLAQINGRDMVGDKDKVKMDYRYMKNISFSCDAKILCQTVISVLKHDGIIGCTRQKEKLFNERHIYKSKI